MDQDNISISWKDLPWKKFQGKIFHLQCKIYKAKQANDYKNVKRFQKLLIKSKSIHFLACRDIAELSTKKGFLLSDTTKLSIVNHLDSLSNGWGSLNLDSFFTVKESYLYLSLIRDNIVPYILKLATDPLYGRYIPTLKKSTLELSRKELSPKFAIPKAKKVLAINFGVNFKRILPHFIMKKKFLPQKYKFYICKLLKLSIFNKKTNCGEKGIYSISSFLLTLFLNDFCLLHEGIGLTITSSKFFIKKLMSFCSNDIVLFFLKVGEDECRFFSKIRDFFSKIGIYLYSKDINLLAIKMGHSFLKWNFRLKRKKLLHYPDNTNLPALKNKVISILKIEKTNVKTKIKIISYFIKKWYTSNEFCSRLRLKTQLYYLMRLVIRHVKNTTNFTKNSISRLIMYFLSLYS
jgi:hypothetical protein